MVKWSKDPPLFPILGNSEQDQHRMTSPVFNTSFPLATVASTSLQGALKDSLLKVSYRVTWAKTFFRTASQPYLVVVSMCGIW